MTTQPTETATPPKPAHTLTTFNQRLIDAGAPELPAELQYVVQYGPTFNDGIKVTLDIYSKDKKKLLASQETIVQRKDVSVRHFVELAFRCVEQLSYESKLPKSVRVLLIGAD